MPPAPKRDTRVSPPVTRLMGAIETELAAYGITTCFLGVVAGAAIDPLILGDGSGGDAVWIRIGEVQPTLTSEGASVAECQSKLLVDLEIGYLTCYPLEENGDPLSPAQNLAISDLVHAAMLAIYTAISCREWRKNPNGTKVDFEVTAWRPAGPIGASIGGAWYIQLIL